MPEYNLPTGLTEWNTWVDTIIASAGLTASRDSQEWALSAEILHMSKETVINDAYFVNVLKFAAAKQVASQVFLDIKERQRLAKAEDTAPSSVPNANS